MKRSGSRRRRSLAMAVATLAISLGAVVPVNAEIATYAQDTWGVYDSVLSGTLTDRVDSEVMAMERIGELVYVGGKFTQVRRTAGSVPIDQSYLAAFDARTGTYVAGFDVDLSGPVYSLQASPDGSRLFVGGEFGDVAGVPNTKALVAVNPLTGAVDTSWKAQVKRDGRAVVYEMDADANWLYIGGSFDGVGGGEGVTRLDVGNAARVSLATGVPDYSFRPFANGGVWGIAASPASDRVYLSGYFTRVNNVAGSDGFVVLDTGGTVVATPLNGRHNNSGRKFYLDVEAVNGLVFVAGMEHILWVLNANDNSVRTRHSTGGRTNAGFQQGGDYQDIEVVGDRVYASHHGRGSHFADGDIYSWLIGRGGSWTSETPTRFVNAYSAVDGSFQSSFRLDVSGSSGIWGMVAGPDGCMWFGGDLTRATRANGTNQARGGFTRHCDTALGTDTTRPSNPSGLRLVSATSTSTSLRWNAATDDVGVVGYRVYDSANVVLATAAETSATISGRVPGTSTSYYVRAFDAAGNESYRSNLLTVAN